MEKYTVVTLEERPDLEGQVNMLHHIGWVNYMKEDPVAAKYWDKLFFWFARYQFVLLNEASMAIACGNSIPFEWNGHEDRLPAGWDGVLEKGVSDYENKIQANSLSALAIVIHPEFRGHGLSDRMVKEMRGLALKGGFKHFVVPVRPSLKYKYPLIPMEDYISWMREDGAPFDPWVRTHVKNGASVIKVADQSMVIPASIEKWEEWTGMKLPSTGSYIINEGLVPLKVDKLANEGVYIEPNVWLRHY